MEDSKNTEKNYALKGGLFFAPRLCILFLECLMNMNFRLLLAFLMVSLSSLQAADGCKKRLEDLSIEELESTLQSEANSLSTPSSPLSIAPAYS
jgi:hypothetical protein